MSEAFKSASELVWSESVFVFWPSLVPSPPDAVPRFPDAPFSESPALLLPFPELASFPTSPLPEVPLFSSPDASRRVPPEDARVLQHPGKDPAGLPEQDVHGVLDGPAVQGAEALVQEEGLHEIKIVYLGQIIGHVPTSWDNAAVALRAEGEAGFRNIPDSAFFRAE